MYQLTVNSEKLIIVNLYVVNHLNANITGSGIGVSFTMIDFQFSPISPFEGKQFSISKNEFFSHWLWQYSAK